MDEKTHSKMILELTSVNVDSERVDEADVQVDIEEATTISNNDESVQPMPSLLRNTNRSTIVVTRPGAYRVAGSASQEGDGNDDILDEETTAASQDPNSVHVAEGVAFKDLKQEARDQIYRDAVEADVIEGKGGRKR